jgi:hypothetical protein
MKRKWEVVGEIEVDTGMGIVGESRNYEIRIAAGRGEGRDDAVAPGDVTPN